MQTIVHDKKTDRSSLKNIIRELGLKITDQRLVILEKILKGRDHVTAQEVFELSQMAAPEIGFATVYRFLRQLTSHGFLTEVRMRGLPARYEWAGKEHHDHLSCIDCGAIREFENNQIENLQLRIARDLGFVLTDHILELYGVCGECQKKRTLRGNPILPGAHT